MPWLPTPSTWRSGTFGFATGDRLNRPLSDDERGTFGFVSAPGNEGLGARAQRIEEFALVILFTQACQTLQARRR